MQKYYIFLNLGPAAGPAQANTTVLQLPIIETRAEGLLGLARADGLLLFHGLVTLSLSECQDEGLIVSCLCMLRLESQEACIEG